MSGNTATVDAPASPSQKTFSSFDTMLEQSELPVLVDFHTHWCDYDVYPHCCQAVLLQKSASVNCTNLKLIQPFRQVRTMSDDGARAVDGLSAAKRRNQLCAH